MDFFSRFFPDGRAHGVVPDSQLPIKEFSEDHLGFISIGSSLPWAWISVCLVTVIVLGIVIWYFYRNSAEWGGWEGIRKNYGLWFLFAFSSLLGYIFIYWLIFAPLASFSLVRKLHINTKENWVQLSDQNYAHHKFPFSQISHIAYIRTDVPKDLSGLWIVRDHKTKHALLSWSTDPANESDFLLWAEELAKAFGTVMVPYHRREAFYSSEAFQNYLKNQGVEERNFPEEEGKTAIQWIISSSPKEMDRMDWNHLLSGILVILLFSPFYLTGLAVLVLVPALVRNYITKKELVQDRPLRFVHKSRVFQIGVVLLLVFSLSLYNSTIFIKSADSITVKLNENNMYYKIQKKSQNIPNPVTVKNWEYWMDLINGNPFTFMDRMFEFSHSNTIEEKVIFNQVNRLRSYNGILEFYQWEGKRKEEKLVQFLFDLSGLDPLVFDYIHYRVIKVSGIP